MPKVRRRVNTKPPPDCKIGEGSAVINYEHYPINLNFALLGILPVENNLTCAETKLLGSLFS